MRASVFAVVGALTLVLTVTGAVYFSIQAGQPGVTLSSLARYGLSGAIMAFGFGLFVSLFMLVTGGLIAGLVREDADSPGEAWRVAMLVSAAVAVVSLAVVSIVGVDVDPNIHLRFGLVYAVAQIAWIVLVLVGLFRSARTPFERRLWTARLLVVLIGVGPACLFVVNKFHPIVDESMQGWLQFSAMGVAPAFLISLVPELQHVRLELVRRGRS